MGNLSFSDIFMKKANLVSQFQMTEVEMLFSLLVTFLLSCWVFYVYQKTYTGVLYSRNLNITLVLIAMSVSALIMAISGNLALSLGMVGALSIVRFRNAVKDPKDIAFMFWAISLGIINGVQLYKLSITWSIFMGLFLLFMNKVSLSGDGYMLLVNAVNNQSFEKGKLEKIVKNHTRNFKFRNLFSNNGDLDIYYSIKMKEENIPDLLASMKKMDQVNSVKILADTGDLHE